MQLLYHWMKTLADKGHGIFLQKHTPSCCQKEKYAQRQKHTGLYGLCEETQAYDM